MTWWGESGSRFDFWPTTGWRCGIDKHAHDRAGLPRVVYGPDEDWYNRHRLAFHTKEEKGMTKFSFLTDTPIMDEFRDVRPYGSTPAEVEDEKPENSRMVDPHNTGHPVEYMTVAEYLRRVDPVQYPVVEELISASGYDRTYVVLGKMAADQGRLMKVEPEKMYHPQYDSVNGWPTEILNAAWNKFKSQYWGKIRWLDRDPELPSVPQPVGMPPPSINPRLYDQIRNYAERKGVKYKPSRDPRWRGAMAVMLEAREGETPQQALVRRNSAAAVLYAIEMEYQER